MSCSCSIFYFYVSFRQLAHRPRCLIDREMSIGVTARIGVGDGNAPNRRPRTLQRFGIIVAVVKRILHIAVSVRPTVDSDCGDVTAARKAAGSEHPVELIADAHLEFRERHLQQLRLPDLELLTR